MKTNLLTFTIILCSILYTTQILHAAPDLPREAKIAEEIVPKAVTDIEISAVTPYLVELSWKNPSEYSNDNLITDKLKITIKRVDELGAEEIFTINETIAGEEIIYKDETVIQGSGYTYHISVSDKSAKTSTETDIASETIPPPLDAPEYLHYTLTSTDFAIISWTNNPFDLDYNLYSICLYETHPSGNDSSTLDSRYIGSYGFTFKEDIIYELYVIDKENGYRMGEKSKSFKIKAIDAPAKFKAEKAYNDITLSWESPVDDHYSLLGIYINDNAIPEITFDKGKTTTTISDLDPGDYIFKISAVNENISGTMDSIGIKAISEKITVNDKIAAPTNITYDFTSTLEVSLNWKNPADIETNRIRIFKGNQIIKTVKVDAENDTISLTKGENVFRLCAIDDNDKEIGKNAQITINTILAPTDSTLIFTEITKGKITWEAPKDPYNKFSNVGVYVANTLIKTLAKDAVEYPFTDLTKKTDFEICAIRQINSSYNKVGESMIITVKPISAPSDIYVAPLTDTSVEVTWKDPIEDGYGHVAVYRDKKLLGVVEKGKETFEDKKIEPSETYTYVLYAVDGEDANKAVGEEEKYEYTANKYDIGIKRISPTLGGLKENKVTVQLNNYGDSIKGKNEFRLSYQLNKEKIVYEKFTIDSLRRKDSIQFTFEQPVDLSKINTKYAFVVRIVDGLDLDINYDNNIYRDTINYDTEIKNEVVIPEPAEDCLTISPEPGKYLIKRGDSLTVTITLEEECAVQDSVIYLVLGKDTVKPQELRGDIIRANAKSYTFKIPFELLLEDITIKFDALNNAIGIDDIMDLSTRIYTHKNYLYVETDRSKQMRIYTISGQLYVNRQLSTGSTSISLPKGVYLIVVGDKVEKIIISD